MTGPDPTDHGKSGSKIHMLADRNGLPLALGVSAANLHAYRRLTIRYERTVTSSPRPWPSPQRSPACYRKLTN
jgi:hypothetical protein